MGIGSIGSGVAVPADRDHNAVMSPKFAKIGLTVVGLEPVGKTKTHLRIMVRHNTDKVRKTIGWGLCNGNGTNWCRELNLGDKIDLVFEVDVNEWNGNRELQLTIVDLKKV